MENLYVQISYISQYANRPSSLTFLQWIENVNIVKLGKTLKSIVSYGAQLLHF